MALPSWSSQLARRYSSIVTNAVAPQAVSFWWIRCPMPPLARECFKRICPSRKRLRLSKEIEHQESVGKLSLHKSGSADMAIVQRSFYFVKVIPSPNQRIARFSKVVSRQFHCMETVFQRSRLP